MTTASLIRAGSSSRSCTTKARASSREQRNGDVSIARDLRSIYVHTRARASEARELRLRAAALQAQAREEAEAALEDEEPLVTFEDAGDVLGMVEAPLLVPDGFKVVAASPTEEQLDPTNPASDALIEQRIMVRFEHYGWCVGTVTAKVNDGRRTIERDRVNFVAKFDVDNGAATDLSLESSMYDGSPSAEYESWLLLEPVLAPTEAAALAAAAGGAIVAV